MSKKDNSIPQFINKAKELPVDDDFDVSQSVLDTIKKRLKAEKEKADKQDEQQDKKSEK